MAENTTTRPARSRRAPAKAAATKAAPAKAAPKAAEAPEETPEVEAYVITLEPAGETKTYAKFVPPVGSGCVGTFYAPLGTVGARVRIEGPKAE